MSLDQEISTSAKEIYTDGYDMSVGEIVSLYKDKELIINPEYQRLFRWDETRKTRFIESILLGIPIPPIFVFQNENGTWELVDGLQRLSTILEFMGILIDSEGNLASPTALLSTTLLPSLGGKLWESEGSNSIGRVQQLTIRRARLRLEILKKESDQQIKYELFQRLNTGGIELSDQEIRNSISLMIMPSFYELVKQISENQQFMSSIAMSDQAKREQKPMELILRILSYHHFPYQGRIDVNDYLDDSLQNLIKLPASDLNISRVRLIQTFELLYNCLSDRVFKRFNGNDFSGAFSIAAFEAISFGFFRNLDKWLEEPSDTVCSKIIDKVSHLWNEETFTLNSGAGVRGTTRIANLLPFAETYFVP